MPNFLVREDFITDVAVLGNLENLRKAAQNSLWSLTEYPKKKEWGRGLSPFNPSVMFLSDTLEQLREAERQLEEEILEEFHTTELYAWSSQFSGLKGGKILARLLGAIGDPYLIMAPGDRHGIARTYPMLERYSGMGVINGKAPALKQKVQARYRPEARVRLWNISEQFLRQQEPVFSPVFYATKEKYAEALGADGKPLTPNHVRMRAMRAMSKAFLKALYNEAKRLHN